MPYGDFALREDIYGIISSTLTSHYGKRVRIIEKRGKTIAGNTMYCFPRIGVIIPQKPCRSIIEQVKREYRITYSLPRRLLMAMYLWSVFNVPKLMCEKKMLFPCGVVNKYMFIEPGNKKIKIINHKTKTINNIIKSGFGLDWMEKEIAFRIENNSKYIIPLVPTQEGYDEELHVGFSFPRLRESEKKALYPRVMDIIQDFSGDVKIVNANEYVDNLSYDIKRRIKRLKGGAVTEEIIEKTEKLVDFSRLNIDIKSIPLCRSHGDLQEGNLFFDTEHDQVYLIDLETYKTRSQYYDLLLFYYRFRNINRFKDNIKDFIADRGKRVFNDCLSKNKIKNIIWIFILEDIEWQVSEMEVMPKGTLSNGIKVYMEELFDWITELL